MSTVRRPARSARLRRLRGLAPRPPDAKLRSHATVGRRGAASLGCRLPQTLQSRLITQLVPAILIVSGLWVAIGSEAGLLTRAKQHATLAAYEARAKATEDENLRLRRLVRRLRTDPVQIERAAAEHLLVARPGSVIYRFPDDE